MQRSHMLCTQVHHLPLRPPGRRLLRSTRLSYGCQHIEAISVARIFFDTSACSSRQLSVAWCLLRVPGCISLPFSPTIHAELQC